MPDPLDVLRTPVTPVAPDPAFVRDLRARIERALLAPPQEEPMTVSTAAPAARLHALTPYLAVTDARAAVDFYVAAFGAVRRDDPVVMPDGRIGHVEVALGDSVLMLADEFPEMGLAAPTTRGGVSQSLRLEVADPDAVVEAALAAGGVLERPVADAPYGRSGVVLDPSGHRWMVARAPAAARPGDVVYASLWTPDAPRTAAFLTAALGWTTTAGDDGGGLRVAGSGLGIVPGPERGLFLGFAVADLDTAVAVVRAAGGTAAEPQDRHGGRVADCVDDQGLAFALFQGPGSAVDAPAFVEIRVPDTVRARAFYGTVLGWGFRPGHVPGTWNGTVGDDRTRPRTGLSGGHDTALVVPTWDVPDLDAALAAVRAAGGTAGAATEQPFGLVAPCADDQGTPFRLRLRRP
ncbi:MAG: Glyoxalase family protein [uncultured Pseudonocardia sp.]|uniref:Glyoxalase family protein n=1 Tax=uncultured Pseudonocardia sp. TaxID=211455 RepID=A0A6J4PBY5_9PSEU|nr:MAG: Glyoxalase family protein [uncultured Pseudonocardia sp.]